MYTYNRHHHKHKNNHHVADVSDTPLEGVHRAILIELLHDGRDIGIWN